MLSCVHRRTFSSEHNDCFHDKKKKKKTRQKNFFPTAVVVMGQPSRRPCGKASDSRAGKVGLLLFVGCLTSQQHASVSQGRICSDNFTCCHTEIEVADPTFYLAQSQYTDTGLTSPSADPITPGAWQGSHWSANV